MLLCKYTVMSLIALQSPLARLEFFLSILMAGSLAWERQKSKEKRKKDARQEEGARGEAGLEGTARTGPVLSGVGVCAEWTASPVGAISTQLSLQLPPARLVSSRSEPEPRCSPSRAGSLPLSPSRSQGQRAVDGGPCCHTVHDSGRQGTPHWGRCGSRGAQASGRRGGRRRGGSLRPERAPRPAPTHL